MTLSSCFLGKFGRMRSLIVKRLSVLQPDLYSFPARELVLVPVGIGAVDSQIPVSLSSQESSIKSSKVAWHRKILLHPMSKQKSFLSTIGPLLPFLPWNQRLWGLGQGTHVSFHLTGPLKSPKVIWHKKPFYVLCPRPTTYHLHTVLYMVLLYFHFSPNHKLILSGYRLMGRGFYFDMPKSNTNTGNFSHFCQRHFTYFVVREQMVPFVEVGLLLTRI
jgi:hypothetical protein